MSLCLRPAKSPTSNTHPFRVRGKIFATVPPNGEHLHIFVDEEERDPLIEAEPEVFEALHWGAKVVGVKVTLLRANARTVNHLLLQSWKRKAPKRLARDLDSSMK